MNKLKNSGFIVFSGQGIRAEKKIFIQYEHIAFTLEIKNDFLPSAGGGGRAPAGTRRHSKKRLIVLRHAAPRLNIVLYLSTCVHDRYTLAWIDPKTGKRPGYIKDNSMDSPSKYLDYMKRTINPNERYVIGFSWKGKGNGGHIVNLDLDDNGEIRITDNQRGEHERREYLGDKAVLKYLKQMKWSETISGYKMPKVPKMLRIDNLQFEPDVAKKIMKERE